MEVSICMTEEEEQLADSYAKLHGVSLAEAFKRALFEQIEDEFDLKAYEEAMDEYRANPVTYRFEDVARELNL